MSRSPVRVGASVVLWYSTQVVFGEFSYRQFDNVRMYVCTCSKICIEKLRMYLRSTWALQPTPSRDIHVTSVHLHANSQGVHTGVRRYELGLTSVRTRTILYCKNSYLYKMTHF